MIINKMDANILRSKLLYWRFTTLTKLPLILPESKSGRIIEMFIPLFTVARVFKNKNGVKTIISYDGIEKILKDKIKELEGCGKMRKLNLSKHRFYR